MTRPRIAGSEFTCSAALAIETHSIDAAPIGIIAIIAAGEFGFIGQHAGARYSVAVGGAASLLAGIYGLINAAKRRAARLAEARDVDNGFGPLPGGSVAG